MIHNNWLEKETIKKVKCVQTNAKIYRKPRFNSGKRI